MVGLRLGHQETLDVDVALLRRRWINATLNPKARRWRWLEVELRGVELYLRQISSRPENTCPISPPQKVAKV